MNILFICHRFPFPPDHGGKIRPFHMIKHLSGAHRVTVASLVRSPQEAREAEGIAQYCAAYEIVHVKNPIQVGRMIVRLPVSTPSSMGYFYSPLLERRIKSLLKGRQFDLIFVLCSSVAQYVEDVRGTPKILDFTDMDSQKWLEYANYKRFPVSVGYLLEGTKLLHAEKRLTRKFDICTVATQAELRTLNNYGVDAVTDWFPNGVDSEYFFPAPEPYDPDTICFVGRMDYYPNQECMVEFCTKGLGELRARRPNVKLRIVGANPSAPVLRLNNLPGVSVTGVVPDVRPYLHQSALMIAPLNIARGTQNKILEAMAAGIPVITTNVAAGGVDAHAGEHFIVADSLRDQVQALLRILENPTERQRLSQAGRKRMLTHHSWEGSMQRLDRIIEKCLTLSTRP